MDESKNAMLMRFATQAGLLNRLWKAAVMQNREVIRLRGTYTI
jgi:hypothetical protein